MFKWNFIHLVCVIARRTSTIVKAMAAILKWMLTMTLPLTSRFFVCALSWLVPNALNVIFHVAKLIIPAAGRLAIVFLRATVLFIVTVLWRRSANCGHSSSNDETAVLPDPPVSSSSRPTPYCQQDKESDSYPRHEGSQSANQKAEKNTTSANVPSHWSSMPSVKQYTRVPLTSTSSEYREMEMFFKKTINKSVVIKSIERVQNPFMWEKYQRKKENMLAVKTGGQKRIPPNEKRLFHGTSPENVEAICKQNFDWRLHGKNATVYGEGSYFALNASYSDAYAKEDMNSCRFMFVAKVLVGSYTKGRSSYRRPPQRDPSNPASDLYDSCVDNITNPTIFVVFDTDQFYPEYIIKYSHERARYPSVVTYQAADGGYQSASHSFYVGNVQVVFHGNQ